MGLLVERAGEMPAPTPLPVSANVQESRPEIGGSFGGFIALVVSLAIVFLISCIGIFVLLKHHEPTPYERQMRRARRRDFSTEVPIGPPGIRERFARLFGRESGWIKASGEDGDAWDASIDPIRYPSSQLRERETEHPTSLSSSAGRPARADYSPAAGASTDSVEVELRAPSSHGAPPASFLPDTGPLDTDGPRAPMGLVVGAPEGTEPSLRESPPSMLPPHTDADEDNGYEYKPRDERTFSVQTASSGGADSVSIRSMRKFDNGTKFKEALTF